MDGSDVVGIISCVLGTIFMFVPVSGTLMTIVVLVGGGAVLTMGIIAVAKGSKIGIGGIILGSITILFVIAMGALLYMPSPSYSYYY